MQDQQAQSLGLPALASAGSVAVLLFMSYESATSRIDQRVVVPTLGSGILHTHSLHHCLVSEPLGISEGDLVQVDGPCLCLYPVSRAADVL